MNNIRTRRIIQYSVIFVVPLVVFLFFGERFLHVRTDTEDLKADAVVVLAGSPSEDKQRIESAIALFHRLDARYLILPMRHPTFRWSWAVNTYHLESTIPTDRILIGRTGDSDADERDLANYGGTYVEARKAAELMGGHGMASAVVVSSAYHMRRSQIAFDQMRQNPPLRFYYHPVGTSDPMWWTRRKKIRKIMREYRKLVAALFLYRSP